MLRAMYTAISGLKANQLMLDVTANNIANVNTIGFKAGRATFEETLSQNLAGGAAPIANVRGGLDPRQIGLGVRLGGIDTMMSQGTVQQTGNPYDLAVQGQGWFQVSTDPTSSTAGTFYTRAGNFTRDANGDLVTSDGYYLVGLSGSTAGKINIPADAKSVNIDPNGGVTIVKADDTTTTFQIQLATFPNEGGLQKIGDNLFQAGVNSGAAVQGNPGAAGFGSLIPGALEMSNVDLSEQFTDLITAQRAFQANSKVVTTSDDILQELVNLKR